MQLSLPRTVVATCFVLQDAGFQAYIVGGAVRDLLLSKVRYDWDFTTDARPEQIQQLFPQSFYENTFGTVGVTENHLREQFQVTPQEDDHSVFEITTFRSESAYSDHRRPDEVTWGSSLQDDLQRRDFTINAMALEVESSPAERKQFLDQFAHQSEERVWSVALLDPYQGYQDLQNKVVRAVGNPEQRFEEDALRMLRAVRLVAQLGFRLEPETLIAMQTKSEAITHVSWERIRDELLKILVTDKVEESFTLLHTTGLLQHILPELMETRGVEQRGHHEFDVWTHSLRACQMCPSVDPVVKLAALLHDIAKPQTQEAIPTQEGEFSFHNHEVIGARTARDIARRLRLPKDDIQRVFTLVRWHMFHYQPEMTDAAIRRFIRRVGVENISDMIALREGDRLGSGSKRTSWRLEEMKERIHAQLHQPMKVSDLAIDGHDVMKMLQIPPSKKVGEILQELFEEVLEDPEKNTREYLTARIQKKEKA